MTNDEVALVCVGNKDEGWTVYMKKLPGIIVEVQNLDDAPEAISDTLHDILKNGFSENMHYIIDPKLIKNGKW